MDKNCDNEFVEMLRRCDGIIFRVCLMFAPGARSRRRADRMASVGDLYQDIVATLWHKRHLFRGESSESTWVYRVALNTALMQNRRRLKAPPFALLDDDTVCSIAGSASDELVERLYELLDMLPADDKALMLLYLDGLSVKEMASIRSCAESSVKNRLTLIRKKLIKLNEDEP